jgi:hypothetical protein
MKWILGINQKQNQVNHIEKIDIMFTFILKLVLAAALFAVGKYFWQRRKNIKIAAAGTAGSGRRSNHAPIDLIAGPLAASMTALAVFFVAWAFLGTCMVWVSTNKIATLKRTYFGSSLPPGRIVAADGELGPQARILTAGFHFEFLITLINDVDETDVFTVPNGKCAIMSAKDGRSIAGGSAFAAPWSDLKKHRMVNDAFFFLGEGKGERGPQTTVLTPGSYTINPFLWETPVLIDATRVEQGTVGVVKSSVHADVDFGSFKHAAPENYNLRVLIGDKLPKDAAGARLVPVGGIGVWEEPLSNGLFYINTVAYRVTMVPTTAQVYEYKGGYKRKTVEVELDDKGTIKQRQTETEVQAVPTSADTAIFTKPEGWDVPQELRVLAQVSPELAPFVVASLGLTETNASQLIEDRVVTPIIRSVVRDVQGGAQIAFKQVKAVLDNGKPVIGENGEPKTEITHEFRAVKVMDLLENRPSLEQAIEDRSKPEALKEGVTIMEVRLAESAIPAELLIARKREQLAQQLTAAWAQEETAQMQRQKTENARAQAEQQGELVKAEIAAKAALQRAKARETEGKAEQGYLMAIAEGQKAQSLVLGQETTAKLQMFQQGLAALKDVVEKQPELLITGMTNAQKFVPNIVVNGDGGVQGAAGIFGFLSGGGLKPEPAVTKHAPNKASASVVTQQP